MTQDPGRNQMTYVWGLREEGSVKAPYADMWAQRRESTGDGGAVSTTSSRKLLTPQFESGPGGELMFLHQQLDLWT